MEKQCNFALWQINGEEEDKRYHGSEYYPKHMGIYTASSVMRISRAESARVPTLWGIVSAPRRAAGTAAPIRAACRAPVRVPAEDLATTSFRAACVPHQLPS